MVETGLVLLETRLVVDAATILRAVVGGNNQEQNLEEQICSSFFYKK